MRWLLISLTVAGVLLAAGGAGAQSAPFHQCDTLAANPIDPWRVGPGVRTADIHTARAIAACRAAIESYPNELRFQFQLGRALREARLLGEALQWYTAAAEGGYAGAQNSLGVMYLRGEGVVQDCSRAARWLGLAADQGYPAAINNLEGLSCIRQA